jgi:hypothetical protein
MQTMRHDASRGTANVSLSTVHDTFQDDSLLSSDNLAGELSAAIAPLADAHTLPAAATSYYADTKAATPTLYPLVDPHRCPTIFGITRRSAQGITTSSGPTACMTLQPPLETVPPPFDPNAC